MTARRITVADGYAAAVSSLTEADRAFEVLAEIVPEFASGSWRLVSWRVEGVRKKAGAFIVYGRMSYEEVRAGAAVEGAAEVVAKVVRKGDREGKAIRASRKLWEAGFRPPSPYRIPRIYGYSPQRGILLQERAAGRGWSDLLKDDEDAVPAARRAADWLAGLQESSSGAWEDARDETGETREMAGRLAPAFPGAAPRLGPLGGRVAELVAETGVMRVPSHGDYHPGNVFVGPGVTTVVDLDTFARREAAYDVGYCVGQVLISSYLGSGGFDRGLPAALAFWRRHEERGGLAGRDRVCAHVARTFLQSLHYELCVLGNGRVELIEPWADSIEKFLEQKGPETLEDLIRGR